MIATTAPTDSVTIGSWTIIIYNANDYGTGSSYYGRDWPTRTAHGEYRVESAAYHETYRRLSRIAQRAADRVERFRKAIEEAALRAVPRELRVDVRRRFVAMPDPSQLELAPRLIARRHDRQSVPSRTRRKLRTWELRATKARRPSAAANARARRRRRHYLEHGDVQEQAPG